MSPPFVNGVSVSEICLCRILDVFCIRSSKQTNKQTQLNWVFHIFNTVDRFGFKKYNDKMLMFLYENIDRGEKKIVKDVGVKLKC